MLIRPLLTAAALLLAVPATALSATAPTVSGPTPESLLTKPSFSWTNGPAGELVSSISVSSDPTLAADGSLASTKDGDFLYPLDALTSTTTDRPLFAGTYYWTAGWKTPDGAAAYERGNTAVQSFVVRPYLRALRGTFTQYSSIPAFLAKGSFASNVKAIKVTCTIMNGTTRVSAQTDFTSPYFGSPRTNFYCSNLKVPERLDGARLKLVIVAQGKNARSVAIKPFTAT